MLRIRASQMAELGETRESHFKQRLLQLLSEAYPKHLDALGRSGIEGIVETAIGDGKSFGLVNRGEVAAFAELIVQFGRNFERSPHREWAQKILSKPSLPPGAKIKIIWERFEEATGGRVVTPPRS